MGLISVTLATLSIGVSVVFNGSSVRDYQFDSNFTGQELVDGSYSEQVRKIYFHQLKEPSYEPLYSNPIPCEFNLNQTLRYEFFHVDSNSELNETGFYVEFYPVRYSEYDSNAHQFQVQWHYNVTSFQNDYYNVLLTDFTYYISPSYNPNQDSISPIYTDPFSSIYLDGAVVDSTLPYYLGIDSSSNDTIIDQRFWSIGFTLHLIPSTYSSADDSYNLGYRDGYRNGETIGNASGYNEGYSDGFSIGTSQGESTGFNNGYNQGFEDASEGNYTLFSLFGAIADTPIMFLRQLLGFEVFGVQAISILMSMLTGVIVLYLIRRIIF